MMIVLAQLSVSDKRGEMVCIIRLDSLEVHFGGGIWGARNKGGPVLLMNFFLLVFNFHFPGLFIPTRKRPVYSWPHR